MFALYIRAITHRPLRLFIKRESSMSMFEKRSGGTTYDDHGSHRERDSHRPGQDSYSGRSAISNARA